MSVEARGELHTLVDHLPDAAVAEVLAYARRLVTEGAGNTGMPAAWSLPDGHYLLQGAAEPLPHRLPAGIRLPTGDVIHAAVPYYLVTPAGALARTYPAPRAFSLEDTLYLTPIYAVIDGLLVRFLWEEQHGWDAPEVKGQGAALAGLTACPPGDLPFDPAAVIAGRDGTSDAAAGSAPARPAGRPTARGRPAADGLSGRVGGRRPPSSDGAMSRLAQPVDFELGGSARTPWAAEVDGERWQVRANEVPEAAYRYSLLVDGEVVEEFHDWPTCWTRVDPYLQREYADEREKSEYHRRIGPSKLVK